MSASVLKFRGVGVGPVAVSGTVPVASAYRLVSVTLHLSAAPVAAGSVTVTLNAEEGGEYDTLLQSVSMIGVTDWVWMPDEDFIVLSGDTVDVAYANPNARVCGCRVMLKAV